MLGYDDEIDWNRAAFFAPVVKLPVPLIMLKGEAETFTHVTSMCQLMESEHADFARKNLTVVNALQRGASVAIVTFTDFESAKRQTINYIKQIKPSGWMTVFPYFWDKEMAMPYVDFLGSNNLSLQLYLVEMYAELFPEPTQIRDVIWSNMIGSSSRYEPFKTTPGLAPDLPPFPFNIKKV